MKICKRLVFFCGIFLNFFACAQRYFVFDTLFPVLWYEKAIRSTMQAMHGIRSLDADSNDIQNEHFIAAIGHISFAHFCMTHINQLIDDDIVHFSRLLDQLAISVGFLRNIQQVSDQIDCFLGIVSAMQKQLQIKANV